MRIALLLFLFVSSNLFAQSAHNNDNKSIAPSSSLMISGIGDGPLFNGTPKFVELYVLEDISDLSIYGLETIHNGSGVSGVEFTFPALKASKGQYLYVTTDASRFRHWFHFAPDYLVFSIQVNGNDAVALYHNQSIVDVFGSVDDAGTVSSWDYTDGFAYRKKNKAHTASFNTEDWLFSGAGAWEGETENATAVIPFPAGTFSIGNRRNVACISEQTPEQFQSSLQQLSKIGPAGSCEAHCCDRSLVDGL